MENNEKLRRKSPAKTIMVCFCALMFVSSFALFAVSLALSLVDITAGGHISFTASGVYAKVTGSVTGTKTTNTLDTLSFDASTESFTTPTSWSNMTFDFTSANLITFTVNFQNLSTENSLWVKFTDGLTVTNVTTTRTLDGSTVTTFPVLEVPASTTKTAVMTFKVDDIYKSVSSDFTLNMELSDEEPETVLDESAYSLLSFSVIDETNKAVSVSGNGNDNFPDGKLVIPAKIMKNGVTYSVTTVVENSFTSMDYSTISSVSIPKTITSGLANFSDIAFESIEIDAKNETYYNENGWIVEKASKKIILSTSNPGTIPVTGANCITSTAWIGMSRTLTSIFIPANITSIDAFECSTKLESISVAEGNSVFKSLGNAIIEISSNTLILGCKNTIIDSSVKIIGLGAFGYCSDLKTITIPSSVVRIDSGAFHYSGLNSVVFEDKNGWVDEFGESLTEKVNSPSEIASWLSSGAGNYMEKNV